MPLIELRDSLIFPFIGLIFFSGLYLTIQLRFLQIPYLFLGLKILSGAMDWKGSRGKLSPFRAFTSGASSGILPGAVLGSFIAIAIAGPQMILWIWLFSFLMMPGNYLASTLSVRFRTTTKEGGILCGPGVIFEKAHKAKWLGAIFSFLFLITSLVLGVAFPVALLETVFIAKPWSVPPLTVSALVAITVTWMMLGGIRRVGTVSRVVWIPGLVVLGMGIYMMTQSFTPTGKLLNANPPDGIDFITAASRDFFEFKGGIVKIATALAVYLVLSESGSGKLATIAGTVRTDFPAKQGLASMIMPLFQSVVIATIVGYMSYKVKVAAPSILNNPVAFFFKPGLMLNTYQSSIFLLCFAVIIVIGISGWIYSGVQSALFLGNKKAGLLYRIAVLVTIGFTGYYVQKKPAGIENIYLLSLISGMASSIFVFIALFSFSGIGRTELRRYLDTRHARYALSSDIFLLLMILLPKNIISKIFGWITYIKLPRFLMVPILRAFAKVYKINLNEAEKDIKDYPSLNRFFTRALRDGARVIDKVADAIVSPVDGRISQFGDIVKGRMIQAKGIDYTLNDLLESSGYVQTFEGGRYMVIYLSPQDYHRIHSPVLGRIMGYTYSPGQLFAVNDLSVKGVHGLFPKNERLTTYLQSEWGVVGLCKVGATNVGKICVTYDSVMTNRWIRRGKHHHYDDVKIIGRGEELGRFEMGSTVILLFEKDSMEFHKNIRENQKVQFGESLGKFYRKCCVLPERDETPAGAIEKRYESKAKKTNRKKSSIVAKKRKRS